ncbi:hypothetical protein ABK040_009043 [Willaertia magna]
MKKGKEECVKVCVRCRPFNDLEKSNNSKRCVEIDKVANTVTLIKNTNEPPKVFTFDGAFDMDAKQQEVFQVTAKPIVESVMEGYNGTVFCYGQTGSGKTHTMEGFPDPPESRGLIFNSFSRVFELINDSPKEKQHLVRVSMIEIYNEEVRDLIVKKEKVDIKFSKEKGLILNSHMIVVKDLADINKILLLGSKNRAKGATKMNAFSSRSHSICMATVETLEKNELDGKDHIRSGKLNMVDLAGSERAGKTEATGQVLKEGCQINLSLSALGNVINALVEGKGKHVPYRDSKLTILLQDSLGGNTKTVMVANFSPAEYNYEETLSTMRYAARAKQIQNKPIINEDPKDAKLREMSEEMERLRAQLQAFQNQASVPQPVPGTETIIITREEGKSKNFLSASVNEEELQRMKEEKEKEKQMLVEEMKQKSEEERKVLLEQQKKIEDERLKIETELKMRHEALEKERQQKVEISKKLQELESKLVKGGQLEVLNAEQREQILKQKQELEERERRESQLRREMEEQQEKNLVMEEKYSNIQEEVQIKTKKLKKLWSKYEAAKSEIDDLKREFQQDIDDYLYTIRQYERNLKLREKIIEHFIPHEEIKKIEERAVWDEEEDEWKIQAVFLAGKHQRRNRPISASGLKRPIAYSVLGNPKPRYKNENILDLEMEIPERTTEDYTVASYDDVYSTESDSLSSTSSSTKSSKKSRPSSSSATKKVKSSSRRASQDEHNFPSSRGLIKKY